MSEWLDLELAQELRPVGAPAELWGRVQAGRRARVAPRRWWTLRLPAMAALAMLVAAAAVWSVRRGSGLESVAARELGRSANLELRSADAAEIREWLRREAGVEVPIPASPRVRLKGARTLRERGTLVGEVVYRVGDDTSLLLVARAGGAFRAPAQHGGLSWQEQQQVYAIASSMPNRPRAACALCHATL